MKKEILFFLGLITSAVVYCQTSSGNTPQLQMSGAANPQRTDTVSVAALTRVADEAAPAASTSDKPESDNKIPVLTTAQPKKEY